MIWDETHIIGANQFSFLVHKYPICWGETQATPDHPKTTFTRLVLSGSFCITLFIKKNDWHGTVSFEIPLPVLDDTDYYRCHVAYLLLNRNNVTMPELPAFQDRNFSQQVSRPFRHLLHSGIDGIEPSSFLINSQA